MGLIVRPITDDGLVGYDQYNQLHVTKLEMWRADNGEPRCRETSYGIADVRDKTCAICNRGWEPNSVSMADQLRWDLVNGIVHESCFDRHNGLVERSEFRSALVNARVRFNHLVPIANGYLGESSKRPWYTAELLDFPVMFKLGSRKRVDHVEVISQGGVPLGWHVEAEAVFASENVTKHFTPESILLHAWSVEKVREYIVRLVQVGGLRKADSA